MSNSAMSMMEAIYRRAGKSSVERSDSATTGTRDQLGIVRRMEDASCRGEITGSCGETMEIFLKVEGERIIDASFFSDGCRFSVLCGWVATELARGKSMDEAIEIEADTVLSVFKEVPEQESHCARLAVETLHAAIHDWMVKK